MKRFRRTACQPIHATGHRFAKALGVAFLTATLAFGQVPVASASTLSDNDDDWMDKAKEQSISAEQYEALGLSVDDNVEGVGLAPYSTTNTTSLYTRSEVYAAANGAQNNAYIVRNGLDELTDKNDHATKLSTDYGQTYGGGGLWSSINGFDSDTLRDKGEFGGGTTSYLSSNATVLSQGNEDFSGEYAKSVEFSATTGTESKSNCVAELRAYGDSYITHVYGNGDLRFDYRGGIQVELMSVDADGSRQHMATLSPTIKTSQTDGSSFYYLSAGYLQSYESYFDIAAGDVDGDGADEIFVYCGAYEDRDGVRYAIVTMFKLDASSNAWTAYDVEIEAGNAADYSTTHREGDYGDFEMQASPVVTLATGDLDRDGGEELAVTVSATYGKKNVSSAMCELFTWSDTDNKLALLGGDSSSVGHISLASDNGKAMVSANCTFGTFAYYDENNATSSKTVTGLIVAGYESLGDTYSYSDDTYFSKAAYRFVYYDIDQGEFVTSNYTTTDLSTDGNLIVSTAAKDTDQNGRFAITLAPIALCTANLYGDAATSTRNDAVLLAGDIYNGFACTTDQVRGGLNFATGHISLNTYHYNRSNKYDIKSSEQIWIGDVVAGAVANNNYFNESFLAVVGIHRDEDLGKGDDYYWMDLAHYTFSIDENGAITPKTGQEEVISESNRKGSTYGTWISLCLPDIDKDGVTMTYLDQYKLYTNPSILAILQDAPYYEDLQNSYDYLVLGGTGYEKSSGIETGDTGYSLEGELGPAVDAQVALFATLNIQADLCATGSYDYMELTKVSYASSYESHAGEGDKVVVSTLPLLYYVYSMTDETTGTTGCVTLPVSLGYETSIVSTEVYDEIAQEHGLPLTSTYLTETTGSPTSYVNSAGDSFGQGVAGVERLYTGDGWESATSSTGATVEQSVEAESSVEEEWSYGGSLNLTVAGGGKLGGNELLVGAHLGLEGCYSDLYTTSNGLEFTGAVDNLPEDARNDYGFQWRLGVNHYSSDDANFYIIGYDLQNVETPSAPAITGFAARSASSTSISLNWDDVLNNTAYRYGIGMLSASGSEVTDWKIVDAGTTSLEWTGLTPSTSYRFVIAAVDSTGKQVGIRSAIVSAATMPDGMTLSVEGVDTATPSSTGALKALSSYEAAANENVTLYARGAATGIDNTALKYTWYKCARGSEKWEVAARGETASGQVVSLPLGAMQTNDTGTRYYCAISTGQYSMQTGAIRVDVTPATSTPGASYTRTQTTKRLSSLLEAKARYFSLRENNSNPVVDPITDNDTTTPAQTSNGATAKTGDMPYAAIAFALALVASVTLYVARRNKLSERE